MSLTTCCHFISSFSAYPCMHAHAATYQSPGPKPPKMWTATPKCLPPYSPPYSPLLSNPQCPYHVLKFLMSLTIDTQDIVSVEVPRGSPMELLNRHMFHTKSVIMQIPI